VLQQIRAELDELTGDADRVIRDAQADEVTAALEDAPRLAMAAAGAKFVHAAVSPAYPLLWAAEQ
jgi:predicted methyltransferase